MKKIVVLVWLALVVAGCAIHNASITQEGMEYYEYGDYPGAMAKWEQLGERPEVMSERTWTRILVYRGLTRYHLGRRAEALNDLLEGRDYFEKGEKIWLPRKIADEMYAALADLEKK